MIDDRYITVTLPRAERALFERITDFGNLYRAYRAASRAKHDRISVLRHDLHVEKILLRLQWELRNGRYHHGTYRSFTVREPKSRDVNAAPFTDRIVHHALVRQIEPMFDKSFIYDSYACRRGKGTHAAALRLQHFLRSGLAKGVPIYVLRADIAKFFANINHSKLTGLLMRRINDKQALALCKVIIGSYEEPAVVHSSLSLSNAASQLVI